MKDDAWARSTGKKNDNQKSPRGVFFTKSMHSAHEPLDEDRIDPPRTILSSALRAADEGEDEELLSPDPSPGCTAAHAALFISLATLNNLPNPTLLLSKQEDRRTDERAVRGLGPVGRLRCAR
jgi:hypothetical protein